MKAFFGAVPSDSESLLTDEPIDSDTQSDNTMPVDTHQRRHITRIASLSTDDTRDLGDGLGRDSITDVSSHARSEACGETLKDQKVAIIRVTRLVDQQISIMQCCCAALSEDSASALDLNDS